MNHPGAARIYVKCYKFSLLGQVGVGKTSLAQRVCSFVSTMCSCLIHPAPCHSSPLNLSSRFVSYHLQETFVHVILQDCSHSTEDCYRKQLAVDDEVCLVELLDSEQREDIGLRDVYIRNSNAFIFAYSVTSRASFDSIVQYHEFVQRTKGEHPLGIIVGNKCDKPYHRVVSSEEGEALAMQLGCEFIETSAKTAANVELMFPNMIRVLRQLDQSPQPYLQAGPSEFAQHRGDRRGDRNVITALLGRLRRR
ncbi:hypothetical protein HGRIS_011394 [Hohenbuehelia grisea]|uniref:Uncharacterized protein n=1 Tax=Hohenbuehelia grisea TaxID=104357 RepID=A0ABR3JUZ6_9AGAR